MDCRWTTWWSQGARSVENVTAEVTTSSPGKQPNSSTARYSADEPELHMIPRRLPNSSATCCSNPRTLRPIRSAVGPPRELVSRELDALQLVKNIRHPFLNERTDA